MKFMAALKSWQVFLLIFVPMLIPTVFGFRWFFPIWLVWMVILIGWFYSIGCLSNSALPQDLRKDIRHLQIGYAIPFVYGVLTALGLGMSVPTQGAAEPPSLPPWVIPLHLASMVGMFYGLWFVAKQFHTFISQKKVTFFDYSGTFFLLWFAPIGVWFIQPKVNQYLGNMSEKD